MPACVRQRLSASSTGAWQRTLLASTAGGAQVHRRARGPELPPASRTITVRRNVQKVGHGLDHHIERAARSR